MLELLSRIFIGHSHVFVVFGRTDVHDKGQTTPKASIITQQCTVCGKMRDHVIEYKNGWL